MEGFFGFTYWFYLLPAAFSMVLGVMLVNQGKVPKEMRFMSQMNQYLNFMLLAFIPVVNIFSVLVFGILNLKKR